MCLMSKVINVAFLTHLQNTNLAHLVVVVKIHGTYNNKENTVSKLKYPVISLHC